MDQVGPLEVHQISVCVVAQLSSLDLVLVWATGIIRPL